MRYKLLGCLAVLASCVCLVGLLYASRRTLVQAAGDILVVQDNLQPADLIAVASGPDHRVLYAVQLVKAGYAERLFFTDGRCLAESDRKENRCAALAEREGIPRNAITVDHAEVTSTYDEAVRLKAFIEQSQEPVRSIVLVSDPHHMRRMRWIYQRVLGSDIRLQMAPVPFELTPYQPVWWRDTASRDFVLSEYFKSIYYFFAY
jgi:uncharacterized SAM-binding protein YcdF (DUF218 family)